MERFCKECGDPLEPGRRKDTVYCSGRCRAAAKRKVDKVENERKNFQVKQESDDLLKQFSLLLPETAKRLQEFVSDHGADCTEAAVKLALAAFTEAQQKV